MAIRAWIFAIRSISGRWWDLRFFLGLIIVLGRAVGETLGATDALAGAIFVGIADIDAITVSMARLTPETLSASHAALAR